jgi:hypothetical protein
MERRKAHQCSDLLAVELRSSLMRTKVWIRAASRSWLTVTILLAATAPLAQRYGWERSGVPAVVARVVGLSITWVGVVLLVLTPLFVVTGRLWPGRIHRIAAASAAAAGAVVPFFAVILLQSGVGMLLVNVTEVAKNPVLLLSEWVPFIAAGGVFGWFRMCNEETGSGSVSAR